MAGARNLAGWMEPGDLAPGDRKSLAGDWSGFGLQRIRETEGKLFGDAYAALWEEFGASHEIERLEVLARRMARDPGSADGMLYEMLAVTAPGGGIAAVRDQTAIVLPGGHPAVVHLSHNLVLPPWRRSGLAGWMRALPISTARRALVARGLPAETPITLVGEMEPLDLAAEATGIRLAAYARAGYRKVDPRAVDYLQPDFRSPAEIDATGGSRPLRMLLLLRRVGRETGTAIDGGEVRSVVSALYRMYSREFRPRDMAPLLAALDAYPSPGERVALLDPLAP